MVDAADELWLAGPVEVSSGMQREVARARQRDIIVIQNSTWADPEWLPPIAGRDPIGLTIADLVSESYATAVSKGWWEGGDRNVGELLMLCVTELSEAMEDYRAKRPLELSSVAADGKPEGFPIELADLLIRVGDLCGRYGIDLETAVAMKLAFNKTRPYRHGGKAA